MSQLPTTPSTVRAMTRVNHRLQVAAAPRLVLGTGLTLYGSLASVYVGMLLAGLWANAATAAPARVLFVGLNVVFGVGPLLAGLVLLAAGAARWKGHHGAAASIETMGFRGAAAVMAGLLLLAVLV